MVITYYGAGCFKVQVGEVVFVFDPPAKDSSFKAPRFQANVVLTSHNHSEANGVVNISGKGEEESPVVVDGPGEYEISGIPIQGISSFHDDEKGEKHGRNTIYTFTMEDITLCHMGDFGEKSLSKEAIEKIGEPDILFLPVGGDTVMDPQTASKIAAQLEPKIVIPMRYDNESGKAKDPLREFVKEFSRAGEVKPVEKLTLKKKDLSARTEAEVIVLSSCL